MIIVNPDYFTISFVTRKVKVVSSLGTKVRLSDYTIQILNET